MPHNSLSDKRLRELQTIELNIVLEIDKVCKKHNLTYFLAEGSLLGAMRHRGFIPWDDDMDISMPRADYNRFLEIARTELPAYLQVCCTATIPGYHLPFSKVVSTEDHGFVNRQDAVLGEYNGVYVDIFPLDEYPDADYERLDETFKKLRIYRDMLLYRAKYMTAKRPSRLWVQFRSHFYSNEELHRRITALCTAQSGADCTYMVNFASSYPPRRQLVPRACYDGGRTADFDGHPLPVPAGAEEILATIYGDWQTPPSPDKRTSTHSLFDLRTPSDGE